MWTLTKHFAVGYLLAGIAVSVVACYLVHNAYAPFLPLCIGYVVPACLAAVVYAAGLKLLGPRMRISPREANRAMISGVICAAAGYLVYTAGASMQLERIMVFGAPLATAVAVAAQSRRERHVENPSLADPATPPHAPSRAREEAVVGTAVPYRRNPR